MLRLINNGLHRYMESMILWIAIALDIMFGTFFGALCAINGSLPVSVLSLLMLVTAALVPVSLGGDLKNGTFRSKVVCGNSRTKVYLAEVIVTVIIEVGLFILFAGGFVIGGHSIFSSISTDGLWLLVGGCLAIQITAGIFTAVVVFLLPGKPAAAGTAAIILTMATITLCTDGSLGARLTAPEYLEMDYSYEMGEDGRTHINYDVPEKIPNIDYIPHDSLKFKALKAVYLAMPAGQLLEYEVYFEYLDDAEGYFEQRPGLWDVHYFPVWEIIAAVVLTAAGYINVRFRNLN